MIKCETDRCHNGGTCVAATPTDFRCLCPDGYTGGGCDVDIDDCLTADCSPGTTCQDGRCVPLPSQSKSIEIIVCF